VPKTRAKKPGPRRGAGGSSRAPRILVRAAIAAGVLAVLLAAGGSFAIHRILTTGKLKQWANGDPEKLRLEYSSATGWFPWDIRVRDLELRSRDSNVEWYLRIDEARVDIAPLALAAHRLRFRRVRATGLVFRIRVRVPPEEANEPGMRAHFDALPPIPGFPARPLRDREPGAPPDPEQGKPLHVSLTGLEVQGIHELWIDIWRLAGAKSSSSGRLQGSFDLFPRRSAAVGPTHLELSEATLSVGSHRVVQDATFSTDASIRVFDSRAVRGNDVWPYISGSSKLKGSLAGLDFLNYFLGTSAEPRLSGGSGAFSMDLDVENGRGKGSVTSSSAKASAKYHDATITTDVAVRARIPTWDFQHDRIDLSGTRVTLEHATAGEPGPDSRDWWGRFDLRSADLQSGRPDVFRANVAARCRDARPLFTLFEVGLPGWARGVLKLEGLDAKATFGLGSDRVDVEGLDASGGAFRIRGDHHVRKTTKQGAFLLESNALSLGLEIDNSASRLKLVGAKKWFEARTKDKGLRTKD
jgi:hypothetical protein